MAKKITVRLKVPPIFKELQQFFRFLQDYVRLRFYKWFTRFEFFKDVIVDLLYQKRGRYVRPFLHFGAIGLVFLVITVGPVIFSNKRDQETQQQQSSQGVLSASAYGVGFATQQAEEVQQFRGGEIINHVVQEGETLSSIAERYGLDITTILWENDMSEKDAIKPGKELRILPVDGVRHKVQRGETIYSVGKRYGLDGSQVQVIVDYPFNEFLNDETFELATGQFIMVPQGVPPQKKATTQPTRSYTAITTPDAGSVNAFGSFVWPAAGRITQGYSFYHKAIDIANSGGGAILSADAGTVIQAGWPDNWGYGNRVMVDHGNGYVTMYAHLSVIQVSPGQRVNRGDVLGQMGSTGRSTGIHLHFEIRQGGVLHNPLGFLR